MELPTSGQTIRIMEIPTPKAPKHNPKADFAYNNQIEGDFEELPKTVSLEDLRKIEKFRDYPDEQLLKVLHSIRQFAVLVHEHLMTSSTSIQRKI